MHGHTALGLHCWQALWLIVSCIAGLWGRKIVIIPYSADEVLLQAAVQAEQDSIALLLAPEPAYCACRQLEMSQSPRRPIAGLFIIFHSLLTRHLSRLRRCVL